MTPNVMIPIQSDLDRTTTELTGFPELSTNCPASTANTLDHLRSHHVCQESSTKPPHLSRICYRGDRVAAVDLGHISVPTTRHEPRLQVACPEFLICPSTELRSFSSWLGASIQPMTKKPYTDQFCLSLLNKWSAQKHITWRLCLHVKDTPSHLLHIL